MSEPEIRIFPLGDSALTVEFGNTISLELNQKALALSDYFEHNPFSGFIESIPAYASTTIFYDLGNVRMSFAQFPTAFEAVKSLATEALNNFPASKPATPRTVEIPVNFDKGSALDLGQIAKECGLTQKKVIEIFTAATYRVFMLGFLPGFAYMGEVDKQIAVSRKETPRMSVPKGSVGIAGRQTGVYSLASPGGWQIIGRTEAEMFTPDAAEPSFLRPGDNVRFFMV